MGFQVQVNHKDPLTLERAALKTAKAVSNLQERRFTGGSHAAGATTVTLNLPDGFDATSIEWVEIQDGDTLRIAPTFKKANT